MDIVTIAIWIALGLTGLGILAILVFGAIAVANGKVRLSALIAAVVPLVVFGIAYAISSGSPTPLVSAAVLTSLILLVVGMAGILLTGVRGLIS